MSHQNEAFRNDRGRRLSRLAILACLVALLALSAAAQEPGAAVEESLEQHVVEGDVIVTLAGDRRSMGMADQLRLTLSVTAPPDKNVIFPEVFDRLGSFLVNNHFTPEPEMLDPQIREWRQEYLLEVGEIGELDIPPLTVTLSGEDDAEGVEPLQLTTEPYRVVVTSILPEGADLKKPKDIAPPVALAWRGLPVWAWVAIAAALVLLPRWRSCGGGAPAAAVCFAARRRNRRTSWPWPPWTGCSATTSSPCNASRSSTCGCPASCGTTSNGASACAPRSRPPRSFSTPCWSPAAPSPRTATCSAPSSPTATW